jgi:glycosyltransferase involved in cell wall biosynthesis
MKTICLNMIVKDERNVIKRCLDSVKDLIDYWVIVDTGSTDGTQEMIHEVLRDIPGELHERPWVNFEHNRNGALELARNHADYLLFIDADEVLCRLHPLDKVKLDKSFYVIVSKGKETEHYRINLINQDRRWKWKGVLHESIINETDQGGEILEGVYIDFCSTDGNRFRDPKKFIHDAQILEKALQDDPTNARYMFYLAQSYLNAKELPLALKNFERRTFMPGENDETFFAQFCVGYLQDLLKMSDTTVISSYLLAFELNPSRAEPLERLGQFFYQKGWPLLGYLIAKYAMAIPYTSNLNSHRLFWIYEYSLPLLLADCADAIGQVEEAQEAYQRALRYESLPYNQRLRIQRRLMSTSISSTASSSFSK